MTTGTSPHGSKRLRKSCAPSRSRNFDMVLPLVIKRCIAIYKHTTDMIRYILSCALGKRFRILTVGKSGASAEGRTGTQQGGRKVLGQNRSRVDGKKHAYARRQDGGRPSRAPWRQSASNRASHTSKINGRKLMGGRRSTHISALERPRPHLKHSLNAKCGTLSRAA